MEVMEVLYHEIFQKTSRRKQMFAWASHYGPLIMGLFLSALCGCHFVRLTGAAGLWMIPLIYRLQGELT